MTAWVLLLAAATYIHGYSVTIDVSKQMDWTVEEYLATGIEFLNHEIFGGLYTQMIFGESFEELAPNGATRIYNYTNTDQRASVQGFANCGGRFFEAAGLRGVSRMWHGESIGTAKGVYELILREAMNGYQHQRVTKTGGNGKFGVASYGVNCHGGIHFEQGEQYDGYFYAKAPKAVQLEACLETNADDGMGWQPAACAKFTISATAWTKYALSLAPTSTVMCKNFDMTYTQGIWRCEGRFVFWVVSDGSVDLDYTFLELPKDKRVRPDLPARKDTMHMLAKEGLGILRMGGSMCNMDDYRWKKFRGLPRETRQPYHGTWYQQVGAVAQSRGFGMFEVIDAARAVGIIPLVTFNNLEWADDMADFVEYCWGNSSTKWGKIRTIDDQHPEPYMVDWIEIGNEQPLDGILYATFLKITAAMDAKSKEIGAPMFRYAIGHNAFWQEMTPGNNNYNKYTEMMFKATTYLGTRVFWDYHIGSGAGPTDGPYLQQDIDAFKTMRDQVGSQMRMIVLEENGYDHGILRAVGHSLYGNVMLRNSDILTVHGYADCLEFWQGMDEEMLFDQGQLFLTADKVWGQPVWYSIDMAATSYRPTVVSTTLAQTTKDDYMAPFKFMTYNATTKYAPDAIALIDFTNSSLVLRFVNPNGRDAVNATITITGVKTQPSKVTVEVLQDNTSPSMPHMGIDNPPDNPTLITPTSSVQDYSASKLWIFNPSSFTVFTFDLQGS